MADTGYPFPPPQPKRPCADEVPEPSPTPENPVDDAEEEG